MSAASGRMAGHRLADATSPYLQSHAGQPVEWYPWGDEAWDRARREGKPVLLSIGYAACHWCHVMSRESFSDAATAAVMNARCINIKVDREERPDLDRIYQLAHLLLTGRSGGWPLTVLLSAEDGTPFVAGTYFPREARGALPAFADWLTRTVDQARLDRDAIRAQGERLRAVLVRLAEPPPPAPPGLAALDALRAQLEQRFDPENGGFMTAPKFPQPGLLEGLLRAWYRTARTEAPDLKALYMAALTLTRMAEGGLYDHVGGGFARYSVDRHWGVPHFEKMLCDQGTLLALYAEAAAATGEALFRQAATGTADWVIATLTDPAGGFCSSLDADSDGIEGAYYVWQREEIDALLPAPAATLVRERFGLDEPANVDGRAWHLGARRSLEDLARRHGLPAAEVAARLGAALDRLRSARAQRVAPARDDKVLAGWNGLMIRGLATAARRLARPDYAAAAAAALDFLRTTLFNQGRLHAVYRGGRVAGAACVDDYAYLADAALELLQYRFDSAHLRFAVQLADALLEHFEDRLRGGFWFTAHDAQPPLVRPRSGADEGQPAGAGVAIRVLLRLGHALGEERYLLAAERALAAAGSALAEQPLAHATLLLALDDALAPLEVVVLRGSAAEVTAWNAALSPLYAPARLVLPIPDDAAGLPAGLAARAPLGRVVAYVCRGNACDAPIDSLGGLVTRLRDGVVAAAS